MSAEFDPERFAAGLAGLIQAPTDLGRTLQAQALFGAAYLDDTERVAGIVTSMGPDQLGRVVAAWERLGQAFLVLKTPAADAALGPNGAARNGSAPE